MSSINSYDYSSEISNLETQIKLLKTELHTLKTSQSINRNLINENTTDIQNLKHFDSRWNNTIGGSYDPQLPYYIKRKNEKYEFLVRILKVTTNEINSKLNEFGNNGWMIISMSSVEESSGKSSFTMKRIKNSSVRFNYVCFKYEKEAIVKYQTIINNQNKSGYDLLTNAIFNKSASFCLMIKTIY